MAFRSHGDCISSKFDLLDAESTFAGKYKYITEYNMDSCLNKDIPFSCQRAILVKYIYYGALTPIF